MSVFLRELTIITFNHEIHNTVKTGLGTYRNRYPFLNKLVIVYCSPHWNSGSSRMEMLLKYSTSHIKCYIVGPVRGRFFEILLQSAHLSSAHFCIGMFALFLLSCYGMYCYWQWEGTRSGVPQLQRKDPPTRRSVILPDGPKPDVWCRI